MEEKKKENPVWGSDVAFERDRMTLISRKLLAVVFGLYLVMIAELLQYLLTRKERGWSTGRALFDLVFTSVGIFGAMEYYKYKCCRCWKILSSPVRKCPRCGVEFSRENFVDMMQYEIRKIKTKTFQKAMERIKELGPDALPLLPPLLKMMKKKPHSERGEAIFETIPSMGKEAIPILLEEVKSPNPAYRIKVKSCLESLGWQEEKESPPPPDPDFLKRDLPKRRF